MHKETTLVNLPCSCPFCNDAPVLQVPESPEPFEATLDTYLEMILLPLLDKCVKRRKRGVTRR